MLLTEDLMESLSQGQEEETGPIPVPELHRMVIIPGDQTHLCSPNMGHA